jgi:hypothetical protein
MNLGAATQLVFRNLVERDPSPARFRLTPFGVKVFPALVQVPARRAGRRRQRLPTLRAPTRGELHPPLLSSIGTFIGPQSSSTGQAGSR